jgi:hypothetical protein
VDLLVDVIIGYMERGSAYLRTVGTKAFALLCDELEESTLDLILAVSIEVQTAKHRLILSSNLNNARKERLRKKKRKKKLKT